MQMRSICCGHCAETIAGHKAFHDKYLKIGWKARQAAFAESHKDEPDSLPLPRRNCSRTPEQSEALKKPEPKHSVTEKMKFLQEQSSNQQEQKTPQQKKQNMEL